MNAFDMIAEPILFAQQLHEHAQRVHRVVEMIRPLAEALLAQDHEKIKTLHGQISQIRDEASQTRLSIYDQIKNMHFHSVDGYAFSRYLACQDEIADLSQEFAALLVLRRTVLPSELHADFRAFATQVAHVCAQAMIVAENVSSPPEGVPPVAEARNAAEAMEGIIKGNRQAKQLGMKLAQAAYGLEEQLGPVTLLFLDKYWATLCEAADNAECTANHLRLMTR